MKAGMRAAAWAVESGSVKALLRAETTEMISVAQRAAEWAGWWAG